MLVNIYAFFNTKSCRSINNTYICSINLKTINNLKLKKMATKEKDAKGGKETTGAKKEKVVVAKRSVEELKKTQKGRITLAIRGCMALANLNERKGLDIEGKEKEGAKQLAGRMNSIVKDGGKISQMDEKGEDYKKLVTLATSATKDLQSSTYGAGATALLKHCLENMSDGKRGFNSGIFKDMVI